jgi:hypothetical protein
MCWLKHIQEGVFGLIGSEVQRKYALMLPTTRNSILELLSLCYQFEGPVDNCKECFNMWEKEKDYLNTRCTWAGGTYIIYVEYKGVVFIWYLCTCGTAQQMQSVPFF